MAIFKIALDPLLEIVLVTNESISDENKSYYSKVNKIKYFIIFYYVKII